MITDFAIYGGLFFNAFVAATLLPAFSELSFAALLASGEGLPLLLFLSVTTGNILGAIVNYWLGLRLVKFENRSWFPFKPKQIAVATNHFQKYGKWSLLFAWAPIIGDPLTLIAGVLRTNIYVFLILVSIGKALRYAVIWAGYTAVVIN